MLSEEEKGKILERLQFETRIKKELSSLEGPARHPWLQSKLALLLIGALITGFLVPLFQYTQETIKWRRQNRYENLQYRLNRMREGLREFVLVSAYPAEAYERARPFLYGTTISEEDLEQFVAQYIDLQDRRFKQNAKVTALFTYFPQREEMQKAFNAYLGSVGDSLKRLDNTIQSRYRSSVMSQSGRGIESEQIVKQSEEGINSDFISIEAKYKGIMQTMKEQIGETEDESETLFM